MTAGETLLEMALRHVAEQEARINHQGALIERLRKAGNVSDDEVEFLGSMKVILETMRADLARLTN